MVVRTKIIQIQNNRLCTLLIFMLFNKTLFSSKLFKMGPENRDFFKNYKIFSYLMLITIMFRITIIYVFETDVFANFLNIKIQTYRKINGPECW